MRSLVPLALLLAAACAETGNAPSLARRPIESRDLNAPASELAPVEAADEALQREIDGLIERAEAGHRSFAALLPRAQAAASTSGPEASESWIAAQQLLTGLESARAETSAALARLDTLLSERVLGRKDTGLAELQTAAERVGVLAEAQQSSIDAVKARISR